jgi:hypothetical protein
MTDTNYLYQYFLEKSPEDKKTKDLFRNSENVKKKSIKENTKEDKNHE